jgi:hypothetical protein
MHHIRRAFPPAKRSTAMPTDTFPTWESFVWTPFLPKPDLGDMEDLVAQGISGLETYYRLFDNSPWSALGDCTSLFQDSTGALQRTVANYLDFFGWVPKSDYETLKAQYDDLTDQAEGQKTVLEEKAREIAQLKKTVSEQEKALAAQTKEIAAQQKTVARQEASSPKKPKS